MRSIGRLSVVAVLAICLSGSGLAEDGDALAERIVGDWQWVYKPGLPIMQPADVIQYRIRKSENGTLSGTAWNGGKRLAHLKISKVEISEGLIRFIHPARNHYFEGRLSEDGLLIVGVERHHSQSDAMDIARVGPE